MRYTIRLVTAFNIPIRVHATFPLILLAFGTEGFYRAGWMGAATAMALIIAVFLCVVLHELGHSLQARRYGVVVRDIVLLPIGGMARAESIPEKPGQEIAIALAGPAVNLLIAVALSVILWVFKRPFNIDDDFLSGVLVINIGLATFNMIPAFPMDGGRVLRGILAMRMPYLDATRRAKNAGLVIAQIFALIGFASSTFIMLPLIAVFIFAGAINEERLIKATILTANVDREGDSS